MKPELIDALLKIEGRLSSIETELTLLRENKASSNQFLSGIIGGLISSPIFSMLMQLLTKP